MTKISNADAQTFDLSLRFNCRLDKICCSIAATHSSRSCSKHTQQHCNTRYQPTRHRHHKAWQWSTHACPPSIYWHGASSPLLAAWLTRDQTPPLVHIATWSWWDGRTSGVTLPSTWPGAAGVMAKSPLSKRPKTPMELPGEDRGGDPSLRPGMREHTQQYLNNNLAHKCWHVRYTVNINNTTACAITVLM